VELNRLKIGVTEDMTIVWLKFRYVHVLVIGKSGTGKSSMLLYWWYQDSFYPFSKIMIEPSGFLAEKAYALSKGNTLYCSLKTPISINPLQMPYDPNQISDNIAEALNQVISITSPGNKEMTVKMRGILDRGVKYCLAHNQKNLLNVRDWIINLQDKGTGETRDGIIQRLNFLLNDDRMLPILCGNNSVKWGELIEKGQSFIMDCFGMGAEKMIFTGNLISQGIKNYFRYERPKDYKPCTLFIDECQLFTNTNFFDILKEGRKYKLSCILATQDFSMMDEPLKHVICNVGNIVSYRLGWQEATRIARELNTTPQTLQFLEKYHVAYMTPEEVGICKAPRPPFVPDKKVVLEPQKKSEPLKWFPLEPLEA